MVGRSLLRQLVCDPEWDVIAVSRRTPDVEGKYHHIVADLLDPGDAEARLGGLSEVTHIFFSAYIEKPTWAEMVAPNLALLINLIDVVEPAARGLQHVNLMHGTKWYGNHLGPFKTPAKETDPRHMPPNFYYDQHAFIVDRQKGKAWTWSSARPHAVCGIAIGNPMNLVMVLAVYATISKALGLPLRHPGSEVSARALYNVTDSDLLARACVWMATDPAAANEPFNITNGDIFRWQDMWRAIADYFEMKTAQPQKIGERRPLGQSLQRHDLDPRAARARPAEQGAGALAHARVLCHRNRRLLQLREKVVLERVGLRLRGHRFDDGGRAQRCQECSAVDMHDLSLEDRSAYPNPARSA